MSEQDENYYCTDRSFNRFNDAFFKYLLATEKHKEFLLDLINAVFDDRKPDCVHGTITDLTLEDRELTAGTHMTNRAVSILALLRQKVSSSILRCKPILTILVNAVSITLPNFSVRRALKANRIKN